MTIINALPFDLINGTTADASQVMANFDEILNDVNDNAAANGANNDITSLNALTTPITPAQGGTTVYYGAGAGTANVQTVPSTTPLNFALQPGYSIYWVPSVSNTGTMTLAVSGTAATAVTVKTGGSTQPTIGGEVISGELAKATYDGTEWVLDMDPMVGFGPLTNLASATTTDLGTGLSHMLNITGTTAITAFGSTANINRPLYKLTFSGAILLTYNATSLLLPGSANITTANGDTCDALYLGSGNWQIINYAKRNGQPVILGASVTSAVGLVITNDSGTPSSQIDISADQVVMSNLASGTAVAATAVAVVVNTSTVGANGLDTGARGNSLWYNLFLISNGSTTAGLASLSATAPTLPSGYTFFMRVGAMQTDASGNFYRTLQLGNIGQYKIVAGSNTANNGVAPMLVASGVAGTYSLTSPVLTSATVTGNGFAAPPTATAVELVCQSSWKGGSAANVNVAPSTAWGGTNNGEQGSNGMTFPLATTALASATPLSVLGWLNLEASTIGWVSSAAGGALQCVAWRDKVNAT